MTHREYQVTGGEVSSKFPKFLGQRPPKASHINTQIWLCHISEIFSQRYIVALNILAPTELYTCVYLSVSLDTIQSPIYDPRAQKTHAYKILYKMISIHSLRNDKLYKMFERVQSTPCSYFNYKEQKEEKRTLFS